MSIEILPSEVIDLIAAGEVIDSLLAVVRELVENALDAGATRVSISICPELWQIQVADNGLGMTLEDLRVCAKPHSTSKIHSSQDLWHITSLGFRGEALHSISQVADLTVCSRLAGRLEAVGWRVHYQLGEPISEEAIAIAPGTVVTASNIFGQMPVRRRALPKATTQLKAIQKLVQHLALCHPEITWQVKHDQKLWLHFSSGNSAQQVLPQFLRNVSSSDLHYLKSFVEQPAEITDSATIELVLGLPDRLHRHRADWIKVAVNGRVVRCPELEQTIISGMARTLPRDRFPVAFLHLHLDPAQIDWNRHPAKIEIYLRDLEYWQEQVNQAIESALKLNNESVPQTIGDRRIKQVLKAAEATGEYNPEISETAPKAKSELGSLELKAVAQVNKTYIVAEHDYGIWLIEQHIAHERILYEQIQEQWRLVPLEQPITLSNLKPSQVSQLENIGIEIESFGENLWKIRNAPSAIASRDDCQDALLEFSWGGDLQTVQVATACRTAIKNGTELDLPTMQDILDRWQVTRNPRTCPHGRR